MLCFLCALKVPCIEHGIAGTSEAASPPEVHLLDALVVLCILGYPQEVCARQEFGRFSIPQAVRASRNLGPAWEGLALVLRPGCLRTRCSRFTCRCFGQSVGSALVRSWWCGEMGCVGAALAGGCHKSPVVVGYVAAF